MSSVAETSQNTGGLSETKGLWLLFGLIALAMILPLGTFGLLEPDEGRYAEIGREMAAADGDWLIPHLNGIPHYQKPPVFYWLTAISLKTFGVSEFAARLPVALCAMGTLLFSIGISRRLYGNELSAKLTLVILASSPLFFILSRLITPDTTMTFWITGAIYSLTRAQESRRWGWLLFVFAGLGFLTKGPVSFLIPFCAAIGYSISLKRTTGQSLRLPWVSGIILSLLIGLSWFLILAIRVPELADYFWKYELVERFGSSAHGRSRPVWFFIPIIIVGFLPWTIVSFQMTPRIVRLRSERAGLFIGWLVIPFLILSLSGSKLPTYLLPLFPGLAVCLGGFLAGAVRDGRFAEVFPRWVRVSAVWLLFLLAAGPPVVSLGLGAPLEVEFWLSLAISVFLIGGGIRWWIRSRKVFSERWLISLIALGVLGLVSLLSNLTSWNDYLAQQASIKPIAQRILDESQGLEESPRVISCEVRAHGLEFYLGRIVEITRGSADIAAHSNSPTFVGTRTVLHDSAEAVAEIEGDGAPIFVVVRKKMYDSHFAQYGWESLQACGDFLLLRR